MQFCLFGHPLQHQNSPVRVPEGRFYFVPRCNSSETSTKSLDLNNCDAKLKKYAKGDVIFDYRVVDIHIHERQLEILKKGVKINTECLANLKLPTEKPENKCFNQKKNWSATIFWTSNTADFKLTFHHQGDFDRFVRCYKQCYIPKDAPIIPKNTTDEAVVTQATTSSALTSAEVKNRIIQKKEKAETSTKSLPKDDARTEHLREQLRLIFENIAETIQKAIQKAFDEAIPKIIDVVINDQKPHR